LPNSPLDMRLYKVTVDEEKHRIVEQNEANFVALLEYVVCIAFMGILFE